MSPQEALNFLAPILDRAVGTKQDHLNIQAALEVLTKQLAAEAPAKE
jgi:hypothetical protein